MKNIQNFEKISKLPKRMEFWEKDAKQKREKKRQEILEEMDKAVICLSLLDRNRQKFQSAIF